MVRADKFIFLEMPKCATTFISNYLCTAFEDAFWVESHRHRGLNEKPKDKFVFASIRNPFDWYVSFYHDVLGREDHPLYSLVDGRSFIEFMQYIFIQCNIPVHGHDFQEMRKQGIGFYTLRYNSTYSIEPDFVIRFESLYADLIHCFKKFNCRLTQKQLTLLKTSTKRRVSTRKREYDEYYENNIEIIRLVQERDKKIFKNHNYKFWR